MECKECGPILLDDSKLLSERIQLPFVFERLIFGIRIEDLHKKNYDDALKIIEKQFIIDDPLCKACFLKNDNESCEELLKLVKHLMEDSQSLIAIEEDTGKVIGVLVGRTYDTWSHTKTMNRMMVYNGNIMCKIERLLNHIHKQVDIYKLCDTESFYCVCTWSVLPDFRRKGVGKALLRASIEQAKLLKLKAVAGIFTSAVSQKIVADFDFALEFELLYSKWIEGNEVVFCDPGAGNYSVNLMVLKIEYSNYMDESEAKV